LNRQIELAACQREFFAFFASAAITAADEPGSITASFPADYPSDENVGKRLPPGVKMVDFQ
jgi:hypothetical protein